MNAGRREDGDDAGSGRGPSSRRSRERPYRRALLAGLLLSLLVHIVALVVVGRVRLGRLEYAPPVEVAERPPGLEVVPVVPVPEAAEEPGAAPAPGLEGRGPPPLPEQEEDEEEEGEPAPARLPGRPVPAPGAPPGEEPAEEPGAEEEPLGNVERLRPRIGDERLWVDFRDRPFQAERLEAYARADSALRAILREWLDSLRLTEEQRRRARDWTFGEGDDRWGISPEGLHLGDVTIPIPFGQLFQQTGEKGREARQALEDLMEIRRQELRHDLEEISEERREEMRERSREEAERRREDTTSASRFPASGAPLN